LRSEIDNKEKTNIGYYVFSRPSTFSLTMLKLQKHYSEPPNSSGHTVNRPFRNVTSSAMAEKLSNPQTLPASWWVSEKIYELEKRAIFSKVRYAPFKTALQCKVSACSSQDAVMDPRNAQLSLQESWGLLQTRYRRISHNSDPRKRWDDPGISQCVSTSRISNCE
jgi:hypothetical protein